MGKRQAVSLPYQDIRLDSPQPMMMSWVGVERVCRASGVIKEVRVLRYSWQFFNLSV